MNCEERAPMWVLTRNMADNAVMTLSNTMKRHRVVAYALNAITGTVALAVCQP